MTFVAKKENDDAFEAVKKSGKTEIIAKYPSAASEQVFDKVAGSGAEQYNTSVTQESWLTSILLFVTLTSPNASYDSLYLSNYATIQLKDELARLHGVGDISYLGQRDYSMRVWLDPGKMSFRQLTANDVVQTVQAQNVQVAGGALGQPPHQR